jgi:hypothetical protein
VPAGGGRGDQARGPVAVCNNEPRSRSPATLPPSCGHGRDARGRRAAAPKNFSNIRYMSPACRPPQPSRLVPVAAPPAANALRPRRRVVFLHRALIERLRAEQKRAPELDL